MDRYGLYGVIPTEREFNERPMDYEEQNIADTGGALVYETDDIEEAKAIYAAGGFFRDGVWNVVTRFEDRQKGQTAPQPTRTPNKRDYDQS
jgi:hypothetical protein